MSIKISNIRDLKIMYLTTSIGVKAYEFLEDFGINDKNFNNNRKSNILSANMHCYNLLISLYGGASQLKYDDRLHYNLILL